MSEFSSVESGTDFTTLALAEFVSTVQKYIKILDTKTISSLASSTTKAAIAALTEEMTTRVTALTLKAQSAGCIRAQLDARRAALQAVLDAAPASTLNVFASGFSQSGDVSATAAQRALQGLDTSTDTQTVADTQGYLGALMSAVLGESKSISNSISDLDRRIAAVTTAQQQLLRDRDALSTSVLQLNALMAEL